MTKFGKRLAQMAIVFVGIILVANVALLLYNATPQAHAAGTVLDRDTVTQDDAGPAVPFACMEGHVCKHDVKGLFHADGEPALITSNARYWFTHGWLNNPNGPSMVAKSGYQEYWVNGKLSRLDGPAVIWPDGKREWWVDGKFVRAE